MPTEQVTWCLKDQLQQLTANSLSGEDDPFVVPGRSARSVINTL